MLGPLELCGCVRPPVLLAKLGLIFHPRRDERLLDPEIGVYWLKMLGCLGLVGPILVIPIKNLNALPERGNLFMSEDWSLLCQGLFSCICNRFSRAWVSFQCKVLQPSSCALTLQVWVEFPFSLRGIGKSLQVLIFRSACSLQALNNCPLAG